MKRIFLQLLAGFAGILLLLLMVLLVLLRTDWGHSQLERGLNQVLSRGEQEIRISGLHGALPFELGLEELSLSDADGSWLKLEGLSLSWSLRDILQHRIVVHHVRAAELRIQRAPQTLSDSRPKPEEKEPADFEWPLQPALGLELQELQLARISLGEGLIGTKAEFSLQAALKLQKAGDLEAEIDLQGLDRPELLLRARAGYQAQEQEGLDLELQFQDQGLLQALSPEQGLPRDVSFQVDGVGQGSSWQGKAMLHAPGMAHLDTDLDLELQDEIALDFKAELQAEPGLVAEQFQPFLREKSLFQGRVLMQPDENRLHLEGLQLKAPGLQGRLQAGADLKQRTLQGNLELRLLNTKPVLAQAGLETDPLQLKAAFSGPWSKPDARLELQAGRLKAKDFRLQGLILESELSFKEGSGMQLAASGQGSLQGLETTGLSGSRDLDLSYELQLRQEQLDLTLLQVRTGRDMLQVRDLQLDLQDMEFASGVDLELTDLEGWLQGQDLPQAGLELESKLQGNLQDLDLRAEFKANIHELAGLPEQVLDLAGPGLKLSGALQLKQGQELALSKLQMQGQGFSMQAAGSLQLQQMLVQADLDLDLPRLQVLAGHLPLGLRGGAKLKAGLQGTLPELGADIELQSSELMLQEKELQLDLGLRAKDVLQSPQGSLDMALVALDEELRLQTQYALLGDLLQLSDLSLSGAGTELKGDLELDLSRPLISGQAQGRIQDLSSLAGLTGMDLEGALELNADLYPREGAQQARADLVLEQLRTEGANLGRLQAKLKGLDLLQDPRLQGKFSLEKLQAEELKLAGLDGDLTWYGKELGLNAKGRGSFLHPLELDLGLILEPGSEDRAHLLVLQRLQGKYQEQDFQLQNPMQVQIAQDGFSWERVDLQYGQASLSSQGSLDQEELNGFLRLQGLRLQDLPLQQTQKLQGNVGLRLELAGSGVQPRLQGELDLSQLRTLGLAEQDFSGLQADMGLSYERGRLQVDSKAFAGEGNTSTLSLDLPLRLSLQPFVAKLEKQGQLQGEIQAQTRLSPLGYLLLAEGKLLQGRMLLDADLGGEIQSPELQGELRIEEGSFEQPAQGILLQNILLQAKLEGKRAQLDLEAGDGRQGKLMGQGEGQLKGQDGLSWGMDLDLRNFRALNSKEVQAWVHKGSLGLQGDAKGGSLQGKLEFDRVQAMVPKGDSSEVVHLEYTEKKSLQNGNQPQIGNNDSGPGFGLDLDLQLEFPARVYVRGRGLDSEWRGDLRVAGQTHSPRLTGELEVARGHMMFLNKRFTLDQGSRISFTGASPPAPVLDITARHKRKELDGIVRITGPVEDMQLELDSDPPMAQDQILARVLFGKDFSQISP
ncbi:MAG: translocation/assembly module TamB domain-containing protein, partial [Desulfohalobiaceae bacterium]